MKLNIGAITRCTAESNSLACTFAVSWKSGGGIQALKIASVSVIKSYFYYLSWKWHLTLMTSPTLFLNEAAKLHSLVIKIFHVIPQPWCEINCSNWWGVCPQHLVVSSTEYIVQRLLVTRLYILVPSPSISFYTVLPFY